MSSSSKPVPMVVDDGGDDGDVERLGLHGGARDDVVVELLAGARLAAGLVPRLAGRVRGPGAAVGVLLRGLGWKPPVHNKPETREL